MSILPGLRMTARCVRLAAGLPVLWRFARSDGWELLRSLDEVVMPLVRRTVTDRAEQDKVREAFKTSVIKFGIGVCTYTKMAGRPVNLALVAMSTSFTRLYDDLIDHGPDDGLDSRFDDLIRGGRPEPASELEQLMHEMFEAIETIASPGRAARYYLDVARVHTWQHLSRRQRTDGDVTVAELLDITRGKGSCGIVVLYTLGHDRIGDDERDLIADIGTVGQMLDDQHDLPIDRMDGIVTPATLGYVRANDVGREVVRLAARLRQHFGARCARPFGGLLFLYQAGLVTRRLKPTTHQRKVRHAPLPILLSRTRDLAPVRTGEFRPPDLVGRRS